jgi:hypothetical protein
MVDYSYPSVFFAYFVFFLLASGALFFFARTLRDGYWGKDAEEVKYRIFDDEPGESNPTERRPPHGRAD